MFGTYQKERKEDKLVFGVVSPTPATFDPMVLQFGYYRDVYNKFMQMETFSDKVSALLKGPGWSPGKPRLGLISDVPEPDRTAPKYSYDPPASPWVKLYVGLHGSILLLGLYFIGQHTLIVSSILFLFVSQCDIIFTEILLPQSFGCVGVRSGVVDFVWFHFRLKVSVLSSVLTGN